MATVKQIFANRENAKKAKGPKSIHGKLVASRNSIKHGFFCKQLKFNSVEDEDEFEQLRKSISDSLDVADDYEEQLADNLAADLWKQRQLLELEQGELNRRKKMTKVIHKLVECAESEYSDSETVSSGLNMALAAGECDELSFTLAADQGESEVDSKESNKKRHSAVITCRLKNALPTLMRYNASVKRDMDRCLSLLERWRQLKRDRHVI